MNLDTSEVSLNLAKYQDEEFELFLLTPGDGSGMTSEYVVFVIDFLFVGTVLHRIHLILKMHLLTTI